MKRRAVYLVFEWVFWCFLIGVLWAQVGSFSEPIAEYRFGASGWPKMVLLGLFLGASGQFVLGCFGVLRGHADKGTPHKSTPQKGETHKRRVQQLAIFTLPLIYLFVMARLGFFVATPLFIAVYLFVLEVRVWYALIGVTAFIYVFVLALFVRFFYVALPVGAWPLFYEINNSIISLVRWGV